MQNDFMRNILLDIDLYRFNEQNMSPKIDFSLAPIHDIEAELGRRLEAIRLEENISQEALAAEAGVSRRTITRLENGGGISVETLIRLMRALGVANRLEALLPEPGIRPIDRIRLKGKQRQRARRSAAVEPGDWTWGDEEGEPDGPQ
jgi:transcriptional regulator with XRE-family HTH domain